MSGSRIPGMDDDDVCPVCLEQMEPMTFRGTERNRLVCCGKFVCPRCNEQIHEHQTEATARYRQVARRIMNNESNVQVADVTQSLRDVEQSLACPMCRTQVPLTPEDSFQMSLKNAKKGYAWAQYIVGNKYERGTGVPVNLPEARLWFGKAARQGHSWAMFAYGSRLHLDLQDAVQAKKWYEKSIQVDGFPKAQFKLGQLLLSDGNGISKDPQEAFRLFQLAADQGFDCAQCALGDCYEMGPDSGGGVPSRDMEKALYWRTKAAEQGTHCVAMHNVGISLFTIAMEKYGSVELSGKCPVPRALFWFRKAAALGDEDSKSMVLQIEGDMSDQCANCLSPNDANGTRLRECGRCNAANYCGPACQISHWKAGHKIDCYSGSK